MKVGVHGIGQAEATYPVITLSPNPTAQSVCTSYDAMGNCVSQSIGAASDPYAALTGSGASGINPSVLLLVAGAALLLLMAKR